MERIAEPDHPVSDTLLYIVAEVEGCSPTELPPLQETVDVDALDALFAVKTSDTPLLNRSLTFDYSDSSVTVRSDRAVTVSVTA
jgi:hypothetical protein